MMRRPHPVVLAIVSGFGVGPSMDGNAVRQARLPSFSSLTEAFPAMTLNAAGRAVGLEASCSGSAEAGHRTIGLGAVWRSSRARVDAAVASNALQKQAALRRLAEHVRSTNGTLHMTGLLTPAKRYADTEHVYALLRYAKTAGVERVAVHVILDGVDAMPEAGLDAVRALEAHMADIDIGRVASVSGRAFAMDDTGHWDRTARAYAAMAEGASDAMSRSATQAIEASYAAGVRDEQMVPTVLLQERGAPVARLQEGDGILFWNTRPFGMRQLVGAVTLPSMHAFARSYVRNVYAVTLTDYDANLPIEAAFPAHVVDTCLGQVLSDAGLKQLRIGETERFAHVTVFLNGMRDEALPGEERSIVPSPNVSSYNAIPDMRTARIADRVVKEVAAGSYDVIIVNIAAPDLVAQTGDEEAVVVACEAADKALGRMANAVLAVGGAMLVVGDHGHAEELHDPQTGALRKCGSSNPVPFLVIGKAFEGIKAPSGDIVGGDLSMTAPCGSLADVAPTMLRMMHLPIPKEMTGRPLV